MSIKKNPILLSHKKKDEKKTLPVDIFCVYKSEFENFRDKITLSKKKALRNWLLTAVLNSNHSISLISDPLIVQYEQCCCLVLDVVIGCDSLLFKFHF